MKKNYYEFPKSSFLGMEKDTSIIMRKILENKNLLKLLYYTTPDWETKDDLTAEQIKEMFDKKQISNIPQIKVDKDNYSANYLRVVFDLFSPNATNPEYRDHTVEIKILCAFDNWGLDNFALRPYKIAGEIDSMLDGQYLTGIGRLSFLGAEQTVADNEFGGISLQYLAIRGNEDKVNPLSE